MSAAHRAMVAREMAHVLVVDRVMVVVLEEVVAAVAVNTVAMVVVMAEVLVVVVHVDVLDVSSGDGDTASTLLRGVVDIPIVLEVLGKVPV